MTAEIYAGRCDLALKFKGVLLVSAMIAHTVSAGPPATHPSCVSEKHEARIELHSLARSVALSRDGTKVACGLADGSLHVFSTVDGAELFEAREPGTTAVTASFDESGRYLIAGGRLRGVERPHQGADYTPDFESRGKNELGSGAVQDEQRKDAMFAIPCRVITELDGMENLPSDRGFLSVWDWSARTNVRRIADLPKPINAIKVHTIDKNNSEIFAIDTINAFYKLDGVTHGNTIARPGSLPTKINEYQMQQISFSDDGRHGASVASDLNGLRIRIKLLDFNEMRFRVLDHRDSRTTPWAIASYPDGRRFVTAGPGAEIQLWDFEGGEVIKRIKTEGGEGLEVLFLALNPNGHQLLTFNRNGTLHLWDINSGRLLCSAGGLGMDIRAADFRDHTLKVVSGGFRFRNFKVEPLLVKHMDFSIKELRP